MQRLILIIIVLTIPCILFAQTDTLVVKLKSGQVDKIAVTEITKITFEDITGIVENNNQNKALIAKGNYPNPFAEKTEIEFEIARAGSVEIKIYDNSGNLLCRFECPNCSAGINRITWDGTDDNGNQLFSGVYYYEVRFGKEVSSKQIILIK